jgi:RNA recognition motif-containing protein
MTKLFIGGFPLDMDEMKVVQLVAPYADVLTIKLVRDRATKICKGYGFIEVPDVTHAQNAIAELNGLSIGDRVLTLNIAPDVPASKPTPAFRKVRRPTEGDRAKRPRRPKF